MPTTSALTTTSATALREQITLLERERATAALAGLADELYMADLLDEIGATLSAYVGAAVTEIASLRAELDGRLFG